MTFEGLQAFECQLDDGLFHIILNRPTQGNSFNEVFCSEFNLIFNEISERADVRAVLLSARGKFFSVGGDIGLMSGARETLPGVVKTLTSPLHMAITRMMQMNAPVVSAVHGGGTFGGAVALAVAADYVVAGDKARFGAAFTGIGYSCDSGSTVALSQRMGVARAKRFVMLGEMLNAEAALAAGLADKVVDDAAVLQEATAVARKFASGPTRAYGEIKRLFLHTSSRGAASQMEEEAQALARVARSDDAWEGLSAFKAKRPPAFSGL